MSARKAQMRGIVVAGDTLEQAKEFYRAVATGNDVQLLGSSDGAMCIATASNSGLQLLDPTNGEELVAVASDDGVIKSLASNSNESVRAHYIQCTAGCNTHIIADDAALLHKCPACASDLPVLEEENVKTNQTMKGQSERNEAIIAFASSFAAASEQYAALVRGDSEVHAFECDNVVVATASAMNFDIYQGVEAKATEHSPQIFKAVASAGEEVEAHHFMCVSKSCGTHVVASDESPLFCPECSAGLIDPSDIATASDEDEDEDDEDEDEEDYDDLAEDEDDEEFEDEDEEDEDDAITLSVSSAQRGGIRRKAKAVASSESEKLVTVAASMVAYAANEMDAAKVEVAYAGSIAGDSTWFAFYEGVPFAKATASSSKVENFASEVFGRTFTAIASAQGVATAMNELGFQEIKPEIKVEQFVQSEVNSQVEARVAQIAEASARDATEFNDRFLAAIATASQGINRGFYKGMQNPIRTALASALEEVGIRGGEQLVAKAFAEHGDSYHKALVGKASEIMQYDLTVQNQIANAVSEHQEPEVETAVASSVPVGRPVMTGGNIGQTQVQREIAVASSKSADDFASKLAGLTFGKR